MNLPIFLDNGWYSGALASVEVVVNGRNQGLVVTV